MAMSFARPDPSSPASVADAGFSTSRRGFDQTEVRSFLRMIAAELGRLQERERFLERELRTAQNNPDLASVQLDDAALTRLLGEETARVLTTARESAVEIRQKAEEAAAQLLNEVGDEAARLREEAEIEASRRRTDAANDAEAELSMAKQQGREMVNEARAYRERVLSELARRRELAREQIEQLLHGRDRLMQSFETARLVAVDVVAELRPLGEPDEYVNLSPTTGPIPVMLPNSEPAAAPADPYDRASDDEGDEGQNKGEATDADAADDAADAADDAGGDEAAGVDAAGDDGAGDDGVGDDGAADGELVDGVDGQPGEGTGDDAGDDVVVDLFSRLRAEAVTDEAVTEQSDAEEPDADVAGAERDGAERDGAEIAGADVDTENAVETDADRDPVAAPTPFAVRDADLTPLIVAAAKKLKRVLADEQNEALETLRRKEPVASLDMLVPASGEHAGRYQSAVVEELRAAANAGASLVSRTGRPLRKADANRAIKVADCVLAEWLVDPMRDRLERCIDDGDGDNDVIGKRVRAVYREWKTQHIDEQLDDVLRMAHGRGVLAGFAPGRAVNWACDPDHQACADCEDNTLAGAVEAGDEFPTGHMFAPAHVGCRCLLLPDGS